MFRKVVNGKEYSEFSNYAEFLCDNESDVQNLPSYKGTDACSIGSRATVLETKNVYILGSDGWVLFGVASGGSDVATLNEVKTYLGL